MVMGCNFEMMMIQMLMMKSFMSVSFLSSVQRRIKFIWRWSGSGLIVSDNVLLFWRENVSVRGLRQKVLLGGKRISWIRKKIGMMRGKYCVRFIFIIVIIVNGFEIGLCFIIRRWYVMRWIEDRNRKSCVRLRLIWSMLGIWLIFFLSVKLR